MSIKDSVELKRENSEKCGLANLSFGNATKPEFVTSTPKDTLGFQKNVKWDLDEQIRPFVEDKAFEGVPKGVCQSDIKGQQRKEEKSLNSSEEMEAKASYSENSNSMRTETHKSHASAVKMKPQCYDRTEDWEEYVTQFGILADINKWTYESESLYLAGSLKGQARAILNDLSSTDRRDFDKLVKALSNRFGTTNRSEMFRARLQSKTRNKDKSIPELAQTNRKLARQAYPSAPSNLLDV